MPTHQIYPRDLPGLLALAFCGHVSERQLLDTGLSARRIRTFRENGIVERVKLPSCICYRTTPMGRTFLRESLSVYPYKPQSPRHDIALAGKYLSLPEYERRTWEPEPQCQRDLARCGLSAPDGVYTRGNGQKVAVEVVTSNYSREDISEKEAAARALAAAIEFISV